LPPRPTDPGKEVTFYFHQIHKVEDVPEGKGRVCDSVTQHKWKVPCMWTSW